MGRTVKNEILFKHYITIDVSVYWRNTKSEILFKISVKIHVIWEKLLKMRSEKVKYDC